MRFSAKEMKNVIENVLITHIARDVFSVLTSWSRDAISNVLVSSRERVGRPRSWTENQTALSCLAPKGFIYITAYSTSEHCCLARIHYKLLKLPLKKKRRASIKDQYVYGLEGLNVFWQSIPNGSKCSMTLKTPKTILNVRCDTVTTYRVR
jgi:hypothetical protein